MEYNNCTAVILCGGNSSRMGFDKSLLEIKGEFALLKTYKEINNFFQNVILVTNKKDKFPEDFSNIKIIEDSYVGRGPLGALVTALESVETKYIFLLACDIPNINSYLIQEMGQYMNTHEIIICKEKEKMEPLFAFYSNSCLPIFKEQLKGDNWRIRKEFDKFSVKVIELKEEEKINNINRPEDLIKWNL